MKYLEELSPGDCFEFEQNNYLLLFDYKKNGDRCCSSLTSGSTRWLKPDSIVDLCPIYKLDQDNNIVAIKPVEKQNV
jgi:hypothetical protein